MGKYQGFSLIEVIVSSVLVASAVGALFAAASVSTRLTVLGQDKVAASQLAREGLEIAKNIRDQNFINQTCGDSPTAVGCVDWYNGLLTPTEWEALPDAAIGKRVVITTTGYSLETTDLSSATGRSCTDYISRETMVPSSGLTDKPDKIFCRRIFIEPVFDEDVAGSAVNEEDHAIRIRSQVAWVGQGRNALRTFSQGRLDVVNPCQTDADEWCTEQVTVLTDWRASND